MVYYVRVPVLHTSQSVNRGCCCLTVVVVLLPASSVGVPSHFLPWPLPQAPAYAGTPVYHTMREDEVVTPRLCMCVCVFECVLALAMGCRLEKTLVHPWVVVVVVLFILLASVE